jgi:glycosyltransferase involved in cell wall biosynthesis
MKKLKNKKTKKQKNGPFVGVVIAVLDEEAKIEACLKSVKWVDEIVLVDTGSVDRTVKIAKKFKVKVIKYSKGSYSDWKNEGARHLKTDWMLFLDADERVTDSLRREIVNNIGDGQDYSCYAIPRKNIILGKELRHGGWWPDYVIRLFRRSDFIKWEGILHEQPKYKGMLGYLKFPLVHHKHDDFESMLEKTNKWSDIEAKLMFDSDHPRMNVLRFISAMWREFYLRTIKKTAFLDGSVGMIYAMYQVWSRFINYAKLWEMQLSSKHSDVKKT